jgi:hypothetical protein
MISAPQSRSRFPRLAVSMPAKRAGYSLFCRAVPTSCPVPFATFERAATPRSALTTGITDHVVARNINPLILPLYLRSCRLGLSQLPRGGEPGRAGPSQAHKLVCGIPATDH